MRYVVKGPGNFQIGSQVYAPGEEIEIETQAGGDLIAAGACLVPCESSKPKKKTKKAKKEIELDHGA